MEQAIKADSAYTVKVKYDDDYDAHCMSEDF